MGRYRKKIASFGRKEKIVFLFFFAVFLGCVSWLIASRVSAGVNEAQMASLRQAAFASSRAAPQSAGSRSGGSPASALSSGPAEKTASVLPQFQQLRTENGDIAAWIKIDGTKVNYPVMQTPRDPEYYLHRNLARQPESRGLPFLDAKSDLLKSRNYLVYGHDMKDGTAFAGLVNYLREGFYSAHPTIRFDTLYGTGTYTIISVFRTKVYRQGDRVFKYYQYADLETEASFDVYIKNIRKLSEYPIGTAAGYGDQLLTLSTCYEYVEDGRLVVVAQKVG